MDNNLSNSDINFLNSKNTHTSPENLSPIETRIEFIFKSTGRYSEWHKRVSDTITVWACGYAGNGDGIYSGDALARMVVDNMRSTSAEAPNDFFRHLNGNWALVILKGTTVYAVVDRTRSYPLLYTEAARSLRVSDSITEMGAGPVRWRSDAVEDFLWAGYPTGTATLVEGVYQIPAGMYLRYDIATAHKSLIEYFGFLPTSDNEDPEEQLSRQLGALLSEAVLRIRKIPHSRIVVPLSGGMDSRVIVALLKKHGFEDVLCFSYGRKGNPEAEASKRVAETLGYKWHFVEYSAKTYASCMFSQELKDYLLFAANGCSLPVCSSWYAVKTLLESGMVSAGDTFVPGHSGDFLAGSHIPQDYFTAGETVDSESIIEHIFRKHFSLWSGFPPARVRSTSLGQSLSVGDHTLLSNIQAAALYEKWDWRERQAKFIINSDRLYEYFGCGWLTPLWDGPLTDFYLTVPFRLRRDRLLFLRSSVEHVFSGALSDLADIPLAVLGRLSPRRLLKYVLSGSSWRECVHRLLAKTRWKLVRGRTPKQPRHPLAAELSFADNGNPRRLTIRQVFGRHGMSDVLGCPECESIVPFADTPVGYVDPFGLLVLFGFANMRTMMEGTKQ